MREVTLKNGKKAPEAVVTAITMTLTNLWNGIGPNGRRDAGLAAAGQILVEDLHSKAKNPSFELSGTALEVLHQRSFVESDGSMPQATRDIVLSAVTVESGMFGPHETITGISSPLAAPSSSVSAGSIKKDGKVVEKSEQKSVE